MKNVLVAVALLALASGGAAAADRPPSSVFNPPPATPAFSWTGFYVAGGLGYGLWTADTTTLGATGACLLCATQTQGGSGWFGRVGLGYDYQFSIPLGNWTPQLVAGVFADTDFGSIRGIIQDQSPYFAGTTTQNWAWAAGGRIGWAPAPEILTYFDGGFAQAHFNGASMGFTGLQSGFPAGTASGYSTPGVTMNGWFIGSGFETTLKPYLPAGWFLRSEYRYAYYGTANLADTCSVGCLPVVSPVGSFITFHPTVQTITTEIVYKFNSPGAEVAAAPALAFKAPPAVAPVYNWSGFYLNGGFGYGIWTADTTTISPITGACILCSTQTQGGSGWFGTVGGGYDYQFGLNLGFIHPTLVAGLSADFNPSNLRGTIQDQSPFFFGTETENWWWSVGARIGALLTPQILSYVNGGFTQARFGGANMGVTGAFPPLPVAGATGYSTPSFNVNGWFVGGGAETTMAPILPVGWFLRTEYRYSYYNTANLPETCTVGCLSPVGLAGSTITFHPTVQTVSTSLVYKFNWMP